MTFLKAGFRPAVLGIFAALLMIWACRVNDVGGTFLNVKVDSTWTRYDRVTVVLADSSGNPLDTLFDGHLTSADQLKKLDGSRFDGGKVDIILVGYLQDKVAKRETRPYDGKSGTSGEKIVVVIIPLDPPPADSTVLDIKPDNAKLYTGGPNVTLAPSGTGWDNKTVVWSSDSANIATVVAGSVKPIGPGKTWIKAVSGSKRDSSEITVVTDAPVLDAGADTVVLTNTPVVFQVKAKQEFGVYAMFKWSLDGDTTWDDSTGDISPTATVLTAPSKTFSAADTVTLRFYVRDGEGNAVTAVRHVVVSMQAPKITALLQDTAITVGDSAAFSAQVEVTPGLIKKFTWDYGDGAAPISGSISTAKGNVSGGHRFAALGNFKVTLTIEDNLGNTVASTVTATVNPVKNPDLPSITSLKPGDTTISIKDSLTFIAKAGSKAGLKSYSWDLDNDGKADVVDSTSVAGDTAATITLGKRFPNPGSFPLTLKITDANGATATKGVTVTVLKDPPVAKAGNDTTVDAGTQINLHGKASDGLGKVVKTEWKIGADAFVDASSDTSFTAPAAGGDTLVCVFRVTDDDGEVSTDSMRVSVSPSSDADLASLTVSAGAFTPAFAKTVLAYNVSVANTVTSLTVTPTVANAGSTVTVNGTAVASGAASGALALSVGTNTITVEVTAKSGGKKSYVLTANRAASSAADLSALSASAGALSPAFAAATSAYAVSTTDTATTITATCPATATLKVNGVATASGAASASVKIPAGQTTSVPVVVTAQDGSTRTYTIAFTVASLGKPDLVITSATITSKTPTKVSYSYTITNNGTATIPNLFNISIQNYYSANTIFNDAGDVPAGGAILGVTKSLAPGESYNGTFYASGAVPAGLTYLTFKIDWEDSVKESNEANNTIAKQVLVPPVANAGADTTVAAGSLVNLHGKASDPIGSVAKTEWKIGAGAYTVASLDTSFTAPSVGSTAIQCVLRVTDDDNLVTEDTVQVNVSASTDADLLSLVPSTGSLVPAFAKATTSYSMVVANTVTSMTFTPTVNNSSATIKVNGVSVSSGAASGSIALAVGSNSVSVEVTAQSGLKKTYTVAVSRTGSSVNTLDNLTASAGALSPAFASGTLAYSMTTTSTSTTITPTVTAGSNATVTVNGVAVTSGSASASINLPSGSITNVDIVVTSETGTTRTYTIAFTVPGSSLPDLIITAWKITNVASNRYDYTYTIKNNGGTTIPNLYNVSIQNFYSADSIFYNAGDVGAGGSILGITKSLAPGESYSGTYYSSGTPGTGMKYIVWKIDWGDIVSESDETNNTAAMPLP